MLGVGTPIALQNNRALSPTLAEKVEFPFKIIGESEKKFNFNFNLKVLQLEHVLFVKNYKKVRI